MNARQFSVVFTLILLSVLPTSASRHYIKPDYSIYAKPNYIDKIGHTHDTLYIEPQASVDGFVRFDYGGRTAYISDQSVFFEGDPVSDFAYDNPGNAFWRKTISKGNDRYEIYYDESGAVTAVIGRMPSNHFVLLCDGLGACKARIAIDSRTGSPKGGHGAIQVYDEGLPPGAPKFLDGFFTTYGHSDDRGNCLVLDKGKMGSATAAVSYDYRDVSQPDVAAYEMFGSLRAMVTEYDVENSNVAKRAIGSAGMFAYGALLVFLFGYMVMYFIGFRWLNGFWNKLAGYDFAPNKRINLLLLRGILPCVFLFLPLGIGQSAIGGAEVFGSARQFYEMSLLLFCGLLLSLAWIYVEARFINRRLPTRAAYCRTLYAAIALGATIMLLVFLMYIAVAILVILFFCGMVFGGGGSVSGSGVPSGGARVSCSTCRYHRDTFAGGECSLGNIRSSADSCSDYAL